MENLFDNKTYQSVLKRIDKLSAHSIPQWGKMNVAQMLAHCTKALEFPNTDAEAPRMLVGYLFGWLIKAQVYNDVPFRKNLPTSNLLIVEEPRSLMHEQTELKKAIDTFHGLGPGVAGKHPHPLFGRLTAEQWGKFMFKHIDHHLKQFGV